MKIFDKIFKIKEETNMCEYKINESELKFEGIEKQMKDIFLEGTVEYGSPKEGLDFLNYKIKHDGVLNYNTDKESKYMIDSYLEALNHIYGDGQIEYDLNNMQWWLMHDKNDHGNYNWALDELKWLIHGENYFDYNGDIEPYKKWSIDKAIEKLEKKRLN